MAAAAAAPCVYCIGSYVKFDDNLNWDGIDALDHV